MNGPCGSIGGQNRQETSSGKVLDCCVIPFVLTDKWSQLEEWQRELSFTWLWGLDKISRSLSVDQRRRTNTSLPFFHVPFPGPFDAGISSSAVSPSLLCCPSLFLHPRRATFNQVLVLHSNIGPFLMLTRTCIFSGSVSSIHGLWCGECWILNK